MYIFILIGFYLLSLKWLTDRWTDRQTDRQSPLGSEQRKVHKYFYPQATDANSLCSTCTYTCLPSLPPTADIFKYISHFVARTDNNLNCICLPNAF